MGTIEHIFIFAERGGPGVSRVRITALAEQGIEGDRYSIATNRKSADYQLTLIEAETIEQFVSETGLSLSPAAPRRNLVTRGVRLNQLLAKQFIVGSVVLHGLELCEPCRLFASRTHQECLPWFVSRGGLRAKILNTGAITIGDEVRSA